MRGSRGKKVKGKKNERWPEEEKRKPQCLVCGAVRKREGKKAQEISGEIEEKTLDFTSFMENTVMTGCFGLLADFSNQIII